MLPELSTIRVSRKSLGISQRELARLAGVSQGTVAKVEGGKINPSYEIARRLFLALEERSMEKGRKAGEIMNSAVAVGPGDATARAKELMVGQGFSQMPVVQDGKQLGRINEGLLLEAGGAETCGEAMGPPFATVSEDSPLDLVKAVLRIEDAVLVVRGEEIAGIITKSDLLK
jgi:predicted transcriptional regulator